MKKILSIVVITVIFQNCSSTNISKTQPNVRINKQNFFRFLIDDLKGEDLLEKYICMFPKLVNIKFSKDTTDVIKQKYPNPCSPSMEANFILYIKSPNSKLQISILNDKDLVVSSFIPPKLGKGYYAFYWEYIFLTI